MKTLIRRRGGQASTTQPRLGLGGDLAGSPGPSRDHAQGELTALDNAAIGPRPTTTSSGVHSLATRALTLALTAAIACGPGALLWRVMTPEPAPAVAAADVGFDQRMISRRSVASETAAAWVQAWLTTPAADAKHLTTFYAGKVELPAEASTATAVRVVDAIVAAPGVWSVLVSATVTPPGGVPSQRFYQVPVAVAGDPTNVQSAPMAIPAVVPPPPALRSVQTGTYPITVMPDSALGGAVSAFLTAMLTGTGEVSRYVSPGSNLTTAALPGEGYKAVTVRTISAAEAVPGVADAHAPADGTTVHVQALALVTDTDNADGQGLSVSYPLLMTARGGRWEVTGIDATLAASEAAASRTPPGSIVAPNS